MLKLTNRKQRKVIGLAGAVLVAFHHVGTGGIVQQFGTKERHHQKRNGDDDIQ